MKRCTRSIVALVALTASGCSFTRRDDAEDRRIQDRKDLEAFAALVARQYPHLLADDP